MFIHIYARSTKKHYSRVSSTLQCTSQPLTMRSRGAFDRYRYHMLPPPYAARADHNAQRRRDTLRTGQSPSREKSPCTNARQRRFCSGPKGGYLEPLGQPSPLQPALLVTERLLIQSKHGIDFSTRAHGFVSRAREYRTKTVLF